MKRRTLECLLRNGFSELHTFHEELWGKELPHQVYIELAQLLPRMVLEDRLQYPKIKGQLIWALYGVCPKDIDMDAIHMELCTYDSVKFDAAHLLRYRFFENLMDAHDFSVEEALEALTSIVGLLHLSPKETDDLRVEMKGFCTEYGVDQLQQLKLFLALDRVPPDGLTTLFGEIDETVSGGFANPPESNESAGI